MVSKVMTLTNSQGLHMRPAGVFAKEMSKFKSEVTVVHNGKDINAKSIMNILAGCIKCGAEVEIKCEGEDEKEALEKAVELIESGFGE